MLGIKMWKSIRWKFIFIYFLLVFIAMIIVGVFILQQLENYYLDEVSDNLEHIKDSMSSTLNNYEDISANKNEIQSNIKAYTQSLEEEIFIIVKDLYTIVASNNEILINRNASEVLDIDLLLEGFMGKEAEKDIINGDVRPTKNMVFPITNSEGEITGLLYLRADLSSIYQTIDKSKYIFLRATVLALFVTVLLGFLIARSITVPINDVTEKAEKMAQGDFNQRVSVKSDDEIGRLAEMFNFLDRKSVV